MSGIVTQKEIEVLLRGHKPVKTSHPETARPIETAPPAWPKNFGPAQSVK